MHEQSAYMQRIYLSYASGYMYSNPQVLKHKTATKYHLKTSLFARFLINRKPAIFFISRQLELAQCNKIVFSERELIASPSVCLSSVCLSVTFVRPTQTTEIFGNIYAVRYVRWPSVDIKVKFYGDRPRRTPSSGGVKHKR